MRASSMTISNSFSSILNTYDGQRLYTNVESFVVSCMFLQQNTHVAKFETISTNEKVKYYFWNEECGVEHCLQFQYNFKSQLKALMFEEKK